MRYRRAITSVLVLLLVGSSGVAAQATDGVRTVVYRDRPIPLSLVPGEEKTLSFPEDVQWFEPNAVIGLIDGEASAGQVFLTATEPFESVRFRFHGIDSGRFYLLDLTASDRGERSAVRITVPENVVASERTERAPPLATGVLELTRYAMQQLYAPERLVTPLDDVSELRLKDRRPKTRMVPGADVRVEPIAQWRTNDGLHAVALLFTNRTDRPVELDPRRIRADSRWRTIAFTNAVLAPSNIVGDTTAGVVIADGEWTVVSEWLR